MEIDKIIRKLNQDRNTPNISSDSLENTHLTAVEKAFFKTFSPEKRLIIYGSLAPNAENHWVVEHIKGNWQKGVVKGLLLKEGWGADLGYYGFKHTELENQEDINVFVLFSDELVAHWQAIDDFEGSEYKRILAKYQLNDGQIGVGFIYAVNKD
jgi:gamma-glutamylcyclotransferase (GGCT)/AIG2-like uncharacterized protein YtfP